MKIEISKYFSEQGYTAAYKMTDSSGRAEVQLIKKGDNNSEKRCISYARYLWISEHGDIPEGYEVDHINNDFTEIYNGIAEKIIDNIKKWYEIGHTTFLLYFMPYF